MSEFTSNDNEGNPTVDTINDSPPQPPPVPPSSSPTGSRVRISSNESPTAAPLRQRPVLSRQVSLLVSTEEHNRARGPNEFFGEYKDIRSELDYKYHLSSYTKERQELQDKIIDSMLSSTAIHDVNDNFCTVPTEPWAVFTAGAMGAGKSFTIRRLLQNNRFPMVAFVPVDPDLIRRHLPEFEAYVETDPDRAGELTRKESGYIVEILTEAAFQQGLNVLVDGSLRDHEWYTGYFKRIKETYPKRKIGILHVTAPREMVLERARLRGKKTGRIIPEAILNAALDQVPKSVKILAPLADYTCEIENSVQSEGDDITLVKTSDGDGRTTWEAFTKVWMQVCAWVPMNKRQSLQRRETKRVEDALDQVL